MTRAELIQFINANIYPNGRNQITAPMVRDSILAVVGFLGDAAVKDIGAVLENNTDLVTGGAVYDAIRAYLSSVMKMVGETTTDVITNPTANPVYVDGEPHSAQKGDVVVYGYKEFWWTGSQWKELGDEASWALKTITITGTGDITGGGSLEANRTLDLTQNAKDKLAHGETAFSWLESYSTNRLRLKSPYAYLNARKGLILEEETDYTNTPADFVKQVITIGETEYTILRSKLPIVSDSFISAGGVSPGGGASGTTLDAVWGSLTTNTDDFANDKIHSGHIPLGSGLGVDGSGNIYVTSQGTVTGIKIGSTTYTPSAGSTIVDISSGIPTSMAWSAITSTPTTLAGYGITDAKIESGVITLGSNTITPLTSHQTLYNLVINNSAGTAQITYQPGVSGTYALTLTKAMVGLSNVENTALSTWAGTSNITTLGTISTGVWQGTAIGYNYVAAHYIGRTRTTASADQATLLGIDAISNASSSGSSDTSRIVWDSTNNAWHFLGGIYADSFISAGGLSSGGGTGGIDLAAMWASLQNTDIETTYDSYKFATAHLPALTANNGLTASYGSSSSGSGLADTLTIGVGSSYKLPLVTEWNAKADASALNDYLPLTGGTLSNASRVILSLNQTDSSGLGPYIEFRLDSVGLGTHGAHATVGAFVDYYSNGVFSTSFRVRSDLYFYVNGSEKQVYHSGNFIAGTNYQAPLGYTPVNKAGDSMSGLLSVTNAGGNNYNEGIRIHMADDYFCGVMLCGFDNAGDSGTSANTWSIFNNGGNFYVNRNGSISNTGYELCNVSGNWGVGTVSPSYKVDVNGTLNATTIYQNGVALGGAAFYSVTDSSSASAIGTGTSLVTERDVYYGLPSINGVHTYTSSDSIYAVTSTGTAGYVIIADTNGKPSWTAQSNIAAGSATYDSNGNTISSTYVKLTASSSQTISNAGADLPVLILKGYSSYSSVLFENGSGGFLGYFGVDSTVGLYFHDGVQRNVYHSGNANNTSTAWSASVITCANNLTLGSASNANPYLTFLDDTTATSIAMYSNILYFGSYTEGLTYNVSNKRVGIGTNSPVDKLSVYDGRINVDQATSVAIKLNNSGSYAETQIQYNYQGSYKSAIGWWTTVGTYLYDAACGKYLSVTDSGEMRFGTYTAATFVQDTTGCVSLYGLSGSNYNEGIRIHATSSGWCDIVLCGTDNTGDSGTSSNTWGIFNYAGNFYINKNASAFNATNVLCNVSGNWGIGTTSPNYKLHVSGDIVATGAVTAGSASDISFKSNIKKITAESAKSLIMAMNPVTFTWNSLATSLYDKYVGDDLGLVAQEVEPYLPMAISPIFEKYKRLDYTKLIAPIIRVEQDHETRIQQLERENEELKGEIQRLKSARLTN